MDPSLKNIKTCHVTTVDITARFIILGFLRFLKREGSNPTLVSSFSKFRIFLEKEGFDLKDIPMTRRITPWEDIVSFIQLYRYFKKEQFDIVHTYTPKAGILGRIAARLAGVPVVIHSSYGFYIGNNLPWHIRETILFAEKVAAWFCDLVLSQNQEDINLAISRNIVPTNKITLMTYGIDLNRFRPDVLSPERIEKKKQELGLSGKKVIGMVGRFVKEKGYLDLFAAFQEVKKQHPDAKLLLVAQEDRVKPDALNLSVLKEYGIEQDVVVLGHEQEVAEMEEIYPLMDIFVLPSYREGFPFSIMEASACGKAVVASDIRGCREAVEDGKTGMLVPAGNASVLAKTLTDLLSNPQRTEQMGKAGREKAEREFDERVIFDRISRIYADYLSRKK